MKQVTLGSKLYLVREETDPRKDVLLFMGLGSGAAPPLFHPDPADVWVQDSDGNIVPVHDRFTIEMVKKEAAALVDPKTTAPEWKHAFRRWLDQQIEAGNVTLARRQTARVG